MPPWVLLHAHILVSRTGCETHERSFARGCLMVLRGASRAVQKAQKPGRTVTYEEALAGGARGDVRLSSSLRRAWRVGCSARRDARYTIHVGRRRWGRREARRAPREGLGEGCTILGSGWGGYEVLRAIDKKRWSESILILEVLKLSARVRRKSFAQLDNLRYLDAHCARLY